MTRFCALPPCSYNNIDFLTAIDSKNSFVFQLSGNMTVFHGDEVLLELFQFTHGALLGTPCISSLVLQSSIVVPIVYRRCATNCKSVKILYAT